MSRIKIAIADDHKLFLKGLRYIIQSFDNLELIAEAENGAQLLEQIAYEPPDVVLMDLKMPVMDGLEATRQIKERYPATKVILLTMVDDEQVITHVMDLGANGYLLKNEDPAVLKEAIESVMRKDYYFNDYVAKALLKGIRTQQIKPAPAAVAASLTRRELEILELICKEYTSAEIARELYITARTVEGHRNNLLEKTGAKNTAGLVIFAIKHQLVVV